MQAFLPLPCLSKPSHIHTISMSLSQESLLGFLLDRGGKVRNSELLEHFGSLVSCSDPVRRQTNREIFKKLVNTVAVVQQVDGMKFVVVKKRFQDFVPNAPCPKIINCSLETSFSCTPHPPPPPLAVMDLENNNLSSQMNPESAQKRRLSSISNPDTIKVVNLSADQASKTRRSGAVFAVIAVKSPPRDSITLSQPPVPRNPMPSLPQVNLGSRMSAQSMPSLNSDLPECRKEPLRETQSWKATQSNEMRPTALPPPLKKKQSDDAKYCESVPLEPLAHEWLVRCAAGQWGRIYALLLQEPGLAQRKDFMSGFTALHWAAKDGNGKMIHKVMDVSRRRGIFVDVNSKAHGGYTPLHIAAIHGHAKVMVLLVKSCKARVGERDNSGKKALHYLGTGVSAEVKVLLGGVKQREKMEEEEEEEEEYKEHGKGFNTISKLFQPHMGKKHKTKFAHEW